MMVTCREIYDLCIQVDAHLLGAFDVSVGRTVQVCFPPPNPPPSRQISLDVMPSLEELSSEVLSAHIPGELGSGEVWWRDHQVWLQERGYMLRPRYKPDWIPSWADGKKRFFQCEDGHRNFVSSLI